MKNVKICLNMMVGNESHIIERVLNSCYKYIDYWIIQCNGNDNTQDLIEKFFQEKNIPGYCYIVEWQYPGWNSDHLVQKCYQTDHGCDWLFRIDADEELQVDDDFNWKLLEDTTIQSWNVVAVDGASSWFRIRIWNAKLPWRFKHDKRHECIILPGCGPTEEEFERINLDSKFRHFIKSEGNSYVNPTKFVTDALELEEQHVCGGTLKTDPYHFFYIGKSYSDCYGSNVLPLGYEHQKEYARRCIFYFKEYIKNFYDGSINEMIYYSQYLIGNAYSFCGEYETALLEYEKCEAYCPQRNEHLCGLVETYIKVEDYKSAYDVCLRLLEPERVNPFPNLVFLIHNGAYYDTGTYVNSLYDYLKQKIEETSTKSLTIGKINSKPDKRIFVIDNFYSDPYAVREYALQQEFIEDLRYYKGKRTKEKFFIPGIKEAFETIIGQPITVWDEYAMNGIFQTCNAKDPLVYHTDMQQWAGMIYLTPNAPFECGTSFYAHKETKARHVSDHGIDSAFDGGFYDSTKFELVDTVGNVFNRLVIFNGKCIHSASRYFGQTLEDSRLFHMFFFD